ncbi:unnamed protein product, partial [Iphiclides podalirius]
MYPSNIALAALGYSATRNLYFFSGGISRVNKDKQFGGRPRVFRGGLRTPPAARTEIWDLAPRCDKINNNNSPAPSHCTSLKVLMAHLRPALRYFAICTRAKVCTVSANIYVAFS